MFALHPQLERDAWHVTDLALCRVLLMNNMLFPWVVLVPRVQGAREVMGLTDDDQQQLMREVAQSSRVMQRLFSPDKLNIAALGNQVPQLHVHIIARFTTDTAWPHPVWGKGSVPYGQGAPSVVAQLQGALAA